MTSQCPEETRDKEEKPEALETRCWSRTEKAKFGKANGEALTGVREFGNFTGGQPYLQIVIRKQQYVAKKKKMQKMYGIFYV